MNLIFTFLSKDRRRFLGRILWGDPEKTSLENRIFNSVMFLTALTGLIAAIYNVLLEVPTAQTVIAVICAVVGGTAYLFSLKSGKYKMLYIPLGLFFPLLLSYLWFVSGGSYESVPYYFFVLIIPATILLSTRLKILFYVMLLLTILGLMTIEYLHPETVSYFEHRIQRVIDVAFTVVLCLIISGFMVNIIFQHYLIERRSKEKLLKQTMEDKAELEKAFHEIKVLRGILPICMKCKKIRDDQGYWNQLEAYIQEHSDAKFSHSLCRECAKELYPDIKLRGE